MRGHHDWGWGGRRWGGWGRPPHWGGFGWFFPFFPFIIVFKVLEALFEGFEPPTPPQPARPEAASSPPVRAPQAPRPTVVQPIAASKPLVNCANCQRTVSADYAYCPYCGQSVSQKACRYCGRNLASGRTHCDACGAPVK